MEVRITPQWHEPLVTWRALVGGPSSGKSPGLASARWLIETMQPEGEEDPSLAPVILTDATVDDLLWKTRSNRRGAVLRREDLAGWMATAASDQKRAAALAGWSGSDAALRAEVSRFPLGIVGTLALDRLDLAFGGGDDGPAARFLYAWPEPGSAAALNRAIADYAGVCALLLRLAGLAGTVEQPGGLPFDDSGLAKLEELLPVFSKLMQDADGLEAAWIGKGRGTIVRLAALQRLMQWAADDMAELPDGVGAEHVEAAFTLWSDYYLPHARAVFGHAGITETDRLARRAARWLRRHWREQVSLRDIRRCALAERIDGQGAEDVVALLESHGALRALPVPVSGRGGGRPVRRWAVNPALR